MMPIGVDYHPSFQTIVFFVEETGEYDERELNHSEGEAERFYRDLQQRGIRVRVGMEATGYSRWFERLLAELGFPPNGGRCKCTIYAPPGSGFGGLSLMESHAAHSNTQQSRGRAHCLV
jgi:hypothetical protein